MADVRRLLGTRGEDAAVAWYARRGWRLLDRNWRCRHGELDLVLSGHGRLVFCEVKTRTSDRFGGPAAAVTALKQARIRRLAMLWMADRGARAAGVRFDVAVVDGAGSVHVIEGAF